MNRQITADQGFIRQMNTRIVMDYLRLYAPISRADLSNRTGLNRSTISSIIGELIEKGYVRETTFEDPKVGRPGMLLQLNPEGGFAVGIEIGVDFISVILTNFASEVLWRAREPHAIDAPQLEVVEQAEKLIHQAIETGKDDGLKPLGIGVGVPGLVDARQGKLILAPNLNWKNIPFQLMWMQRFNMPVYVENEANSAAMGEYFFGAAYGKEDFIYMSTGVGLGGGVMIGGKLFKGSSGFAGEIGHTRIYAGGEPCGCGSRGCWETYVGPRAILRRIRQTLQDGRPSLIGELVGGDMEKISLDTVAEAARQGDAVALTSLDEIGGHLCIGISDLINIFNPELILLGGALSIVSAWLIPVIERCLPNYVLSPLLETVKIVPSKLGLDSCALGSVALVLDEVVREPLFSLYS